MNRIMTKEDIEKKEKRNKLILGIVLVALMLFSTAGYALFSSEKTGTIKVQYKGIDFIYGEDGYWHFFINNVEFATQHNPLETENITSSLTARLESFSNQNLYFTYDSERYATEELARNIGRLSSRVQYVCLGECEQDLPVKNCTENIILVQDSNQTLIKQEDNCIYILSNTENSVRAADKLIFDLLGI